MKLRAHWCTAKVLRWHYLLIKNDMHRCVNTSARIIHWRTEGMGGGLKYADVQGCVALLCCFFHRKSLNMGPFFKNKTDPFLNESNFSSVLFFSQEIPKHGSHFSQKDPFLYESNLSCVHMANTPPPHTHTKKEKWKICIFQVKWILFLKKKP